MKNNVVYIKFDYSNAIESKKDILNIEKALMISTAKAKAYSNLRDNELKTKIKSHKKSRELLTQLRKIQKHMPEVKPQEELKKKEVKEVEEVKMKDDGYDSNIESELKEIQRKLDALQG